MRLKALTIACCLASLAALTATTAGASPRGLNGQIAFARFDPTVGGNVIYTVNPDGTHEQQIVPPEGEDCFQWSPDGSLIATCGNPNNGATRLINPDTGSFTDLAMPDPTLFTACWVWSPDGTRLACEGGFTDPNRQGVYTIRSSDGGDLRQVTSNPGGDDIPGDFSPNADTLVFGRYDQNGNPSLFVVNANGKGLKQITPTGTIFTSQGSWSPQGNEIIFSEHATPDSYSSIWVVHADGSGLHEIHVQGAACGGLGSDPNAISCARPSWSPDGKQFVFSLFNQATGQRNIYTANADGSNVRQVTTSPTADDNPDWGTHPLAH